MPKNPPHDALRYHVSGAVERGESQPITERRALTPAEYRQARMCLLAFPNARGTDFVRGIADHLYRFSAEGDDFAALQDALTVYGEQAERDARVGVSDGLYSLTEDVKDRIQWFAGHPDGENPEAVY